MNDVQSILLATMRSANNGLIAAILIGAVLFAAGHYGLSRLDADYAAADRV